MLTPTFYIHRMCPHPSSHPELPYGVSRGGVWGAGMLMIENKNARPVRRETCPLGMFLIGQGDKHADVKLWEAASKNL